MGKDTKSHRNNHRKLTQSEFEIMDLRYKALDAQQRTTIVQLATVLTELSVLKSHFDTRMNTLTKQLRDSFKLLTTGETPSEQAAKDFVFHVNNPTKR